MIVDTSAIIAILLEEDGYETFIDRLGHARGQIGMSAASLVETGIVAKATDDPLVLDQVREIVENFGITVQPVTEELAWKAIEAHRKYGKGSGHPARLNFGDCFSYALARESGEPLLFKGRDFSETDLESVA